MRNDNVKCAREYRFFDDAAGERFVALSKRGMVSAFIYSQNVYTADGVTKYDESTRSVRTVAVGGKVCVPTLFFTKFLGAKLSFCRGRYTLSLGGSKFSFKPGDAVSFVEGDYIFVVATEAASALGFAAKTYYDGRLLCVGDADAIAEMDKDEDIEEAGAYLVLGEYDPYKFSSEDYKMARSNWRKKLVGSPELNDMSNPSIKERVDAIANKCRTKWETLNKNPDRRILWGDHIPTESNELWTQYQGLCDMAKGWGTYGCEFYGNEELHKDILDGMRWMYENMYGEAEIEDRGWRSTRAFNWWYWYIAAPEFITDIFFIMEDSFTMEEKKTYLRCFDHVATFMRTGIRRDMALSRICICTKVAIALCDAERLYEEFVDFDLLLGLGELEEGPRVDYTQWTHGFPMNMGYGKLNLDRVLYTASSLAGTALEFSSPKQYNQFAVVKYMFEPAIYKSQAFMMFYGRSTDGSEMGTGAAIFSDTLPMIGMFGKDEDAYIKHMIKRNVATEDALRALKSNTNILGCTIIDDIMNDESVSAENDYEYAHAYFTGDRASQQINNYGFGIAMSSKREFAYECINGQNKTGWHTGDGATYLYTDYDSNQHDGRNFLAKNINVAYRFPGTTEDAQERAIRSISSQYPWHPSRSFAGSMNFADKYLIAAMDFEAYHFEGPELDVPDTGYGGPLPVHFDDLVAKKAWFCFDNEIIALGAGINSSMNSPVSTTLEHRRIVKDNEYSQKVKIGEVSEILPKEPFEKRYTGKGYVLMEGHAGFVFLDECEAYVGRYNCEEAGGQPFFEIRCEHGENPKEQTYAYAILPYADEARLSEYVKNPDVEIISNTPALQAVCERNLELAGYVFHEPGKSGYLNAECSAIVMIRERGGELEFSATDPTHELTVGVFEIDKPLEVIEKNRKMKVISVNGKTRIEIDFALANGRPFRAKFKV